MKSSTVEKVIADAIEDWQQCNFNKPLMFYSEMLALARLINAQLKESGYEISRK